MNNNEIWKPVIGYEGFYEVSNLGNVKNSKTQRILRLLNNGCGYYRVGLYKEGKFKLFLVHRLVAFAFIPNPDNLPFINHKDECTQNNHVSNLEWCTASYNVNYGTRNEKVFKKLVSDKTEEYNPNLTASERNNLCQKRWMKKPENKRKHYESVKKYSNTPENKAKKQAYDAERYRKKKELKEKLDDYNLRLFLGDFSAFS